MDTPRTCATCRHWTPSSRKNWGNADVPLGYCEGRASRFAEATADDDQGLTTSFEPEATFGCIGWEARPTP
jgi:hypothetical protein